MLPSLLHVTPDLFIKSTYIKYQIYRYKPIFYRGLELGEYQFAEYPRIKRVYARAEMLGIDLEKRTYENIVHFYSEELRGIHEGTFSVDYLPMLVVKKMRKLGVIDSTRINRTIVSPKALELLEAP